MRLCSIDGCFKQARGKVGSWCEMHYYRNRRHGSPDVRLVNVITFKEATFEALTSDSAWLLGLLWSDGNVYKNSVSVVSMDEQLIRDAASVLCLSNGVYQRKDSKAWTIRFTSKKMVEDLARLGMTAAKSLTVGWPIGLSPELEWHFLRGVFDGDGCVSFRSKKRNACMIDWSSGSKRFVDSLIGFLNRMGCRPGLRVRHNSWGTDTYRVVISNRQGILLAMDGMYPSDHSFCLHRKRDALLEWSQKPKPKMGASIKPPRYCSICEKPHRGLGYCEAHYQRVKRYGSPYLIHDSHGKLISEN